MNNREIRMKIFEKNLKKCDVANHIGITVYTFSHWLQTEMNTERKQTVLNAIQELSITKRK